MSDYLWDKTGEPDAEVERLEELLGSFGHQPRALELPSEAAPRVTPFKQPRRFRPALLAAAALILVVLAGALVVLRRGDADVKQQASNPAVKETPPQRVVVSPQGGDAPPPEPRKRDEEMTRGNAQSKESLSPDFQASAGEQKRRPSVGSRGSASNRQTRQVTLAQESGSGTRGATFKGLGRQRPPAAPTLVEQQAAKEQLVYALRLASAKLNEVRKMTRGEETPHHGFNERDRTR
jgi:hypothetical protein